MTDIDVEIAERLRTALAAHYQNGPRAALIFACCFVWSGSGAPYRGDCSGFARKVGEILGISGLDGSADKIYSNILDAPWTLIGVGVEAATLAAAHADKGDFVLAATPASVARASADGSLHGHVAIVTGSQVVEVHQAEKSLALRNEPRGRPAGAWGQYGGMGKMFAGLGDSFSTRRIGVDGKDVDVKVVADSRYGRVRYAYQEIPAPAAQLANAPWESVPGTPFRRNPRG